MYRIVFPVIVFALCACKDPFLYNINEIRLKEDEKNLNEKNIQQIKIQPFRDTLKFILIGDTQRFYEEVEDFVGSVNEQKNIAFILLAGDISDFGLSKEYRWIHDRLKKLSMPYVAIIGNHDMLANGRTAFNEMFGPENFSFISNNNKFICLNTNSLEVGYNGTIPDLTWLSQQLKNDTGYKNAFVIGHIPPFDSGFDKKLEAGYSSLLGSHKQTKLSMHGHRHSFEFREPYNDGLKYLVVGAMNKRKYVIVSVWEDQYRIEEKAY